MQKFYGTGVENKVDYCTKNYRGKLERTIAPPPFIRPHPTGASARFQKRSAIGESLLIFDMNEIITAQRKLKRNKLAQRYRPSFKTKHVIIYTFIFASSYITIGRFCCINKLHANGTCSLTLVSFLVPHIFSPEVVFSRYSRISTYTSKQNYNKKKLNCPCWFMPHTSVSFTATYHVCNQKFWPQSDWQW